MPALFFLWSWKSRTNGKHYKVWRYMSPLVSCIFQRNTATEAVAREWLSGMEAQRESLFNGPLYFNKNPWKSRLVKTMRNAKRLVVWVICVRLVLRFLIPWFPGLVVLVVAAVVAVGVVSLSPNCNPPPACCWWWWPWWWSKPMGRAAETTRQDRWKVG